MIADLSIAIDVRCRVLQTPGDVEKIREAHLIGSHRTDYGLSGASQFRTCKTRPVASRDID